MLHDNKAPGCDGIPIEAYRGTPATKQELFAIVHLMWQTEVIPPTLVRGTFVMLYKKGPRDNFRNYRAIGLMCHSYRLLSMLHRMRDAVESRLTETPAGFRRERGCRDNVLLLQLLMDVVLRAGKQAVVTFIDYRTAFDTISHRFPDESLTAAGVQPKIRQTSEEEGICCFASTSGHGRRVARVGLPVRLPRVPLHQRRRRRSGHVPSHDHRGRAGA